MIIPESRNNLTRFTYLFFFVSSKNIIITFQSPMGFWGFGVEQNDCGQREEHHADDCSGAHPDCLGHFSYVLVLFEIRVEVVCRFFEAIANAREEAL